MTRNLHETRRSILRKIEKRMDPEHALRDDNAGKLSTCQIGVLGLALGLFCVVAGLISGIPGKVWVTIRRRVTKRI